MNPARTTGALLVCAALVAGCGGAKAKHGPSSDAKREYRTWRAAISQGLNDTKATLATQQAAAAAVAKSASAVNTSGPVTSQKSLDAITHSADVDDKQGAALVSAGASLQASARTLAGEDIGPDISKADRGRMRYAQGQEVKTMGDIATALAAMGRAIRGVDAPGVTRATTALGAAGGRVPALSALIAELDATYGY